MKVFKLIIPLEILVFFLLNLCGCSFFYNEEEARKIITQKDPSFLQILQEKDRIEAEAVRLKEILVSEKKAAESKIRTLKEEYKEKENNSNFKIQNLREELDKYIYKSQTNIRNLSRRLKSKEKILGSIEAMIKESKNLSARDSEMGLSSREVGKIHKKLDDLNFQKKDISEDVKSIKDNLNAEKMKLRLLK